jgi:peroxiredoxin
VWSISPDSAEKLEAMKAKEGFTLTHLTDPDLAVIQSYGLLNEQQDSIPHPATLVIDTEGQVRFLEINVNFRERPPTAKVVEVLQGLAGAE